MAAIRSTCTEEDLPSLRRKINQQREERPISIGKKDITAQGSKDLPAQRRKIMAAIGFTCTEKIYHYLDLLALRKF